MDIKIGITGHTSGFGKHIAKACSSIGYQVLGFSRTNGYDILQNVENIFESSFNIMINNAEIGNAQVNVAVHCHKHKIPCINIGSLITEANVYTVEEIIQKDNKQSLRQLSTELDQKYLTWGFLEGHPLLENNPHLIETITIADAVKDVTDELELILGT